MEPQIAPGVQELNEMLQSGFSPDEVDQYRNDNAAEMLASGFKPEEVDEYYGVKNPDMKPVEKGFKEKLQAVAAESTPEGGPKLKEAMTFLEAIEAGFDMSVSHLLKEAPDRVLPQNAPMYHRIASQIATLAGDVPFMVAGAVGGAAAGGVAGSAVPIVGNVAGAAVGGFAGGNALPEGMRTWLMEGYEKGDIESFGDFWERTSATAISALKGGAIGAATAGVGGKVAGIVGKTAAPAIAKTSAEILAEVGTMTAVGSALEGKMPEPRDFVDAAVLVGGLRGAAYAGSKIRKIYAKSGVEPAAVVAKADSDPVFKQKILSVNNEIPANADLGIQVPKAKAPETFEVSKAFKEPKEFSPEVSNILAKVSEKGDKPKAEFSTSKLYTDFVDKLDPINEITKILSKDKPELLAENNPYILAREAVDAKAKARHFFEKGTIEFSGSKKITGKSLRETLESVESPEVLDAYMISKRVIEKSDQGLVTGFDRAAADKVVKEHGAKYEKAAREVTEFSNRVLDYVTDSGVVSKEQAAKMKAANKDYVPFKRIIDQKGIVGEKKGGGKAGSLKEFKGSERDIQSPIVSIVENTVELIRMAEINRPKEALVRLAEQTKDQTLIKKVKTSVQEIKVSKEEVAKQLGISLEDAETVATFRAVNKELAPDQFSVYRNGKREVYETTPELASAISKLGGDTGSTNILFKIANGITAVKKIGITFTPEFIVKNTFRDWLTGSVFSADKKGVSPIDLARAMGDIWKKNDTYYEWLKSGGANGAFLDLGERYIAKDIWKLQEQTNFMGSVHNLVAKPVDMLRVAAELSEQSIRVAEFKKVRKAGGSLEKAGFASREITIDFQRVGAKISALNAITAFQNVSIQGLDRTIRAVKEDPKGVTTKAVAGITVPSILLWMANKDDERYREIPRWEKDMFWHVITDDWQNASAEEADGLPEYMVRNQGGKTQVNKGTIYRMPKPMELGIVFGSMPERVLESFFTDNPQAFKDFEETLLNAVTPSFVPDAVAPAVEQYFNKSFFTGRDIIPHHLAGQLPETQFTEYTSDTAKALGKLVTSIDSRSEFGSPMVIDNYIQSWGGSLGKYAVQLTDASLKGAGVVPDNVDPAMSLSDIPFIKAFVTRFPNSSANSVKDFYDHFDKTQKVINSVDSLKKRGDIEGAEALMRKNETEYMTGMMAEGIKKGLSAQSAVIQAVHRDSSIPKDEKRQLIDMYYLQMIEMAKEANKQIIEAQKDLEAQGE